MNSPVAPPQSSTKTEPLDVAFIGLGVMGFPMAGHLARAGHRVVVYNRTAPKAASWVEKHGGTAAATPAQAARGAAIVFSCVGNDDDLRSVTTGPAGAFETMARGAVFVDHTTTSAEVARELDRAARERGLHFVDAPVSGGQAGAEKGALTIMCGGEETAFRRVEPVLAAYAKAATLIGASGAGQLTKMVNQICIAAMVQALAEGLAFGQAAGLDMPRVLAAIGKGAAQSWQLENRASTMLAGRFDFGFAVDLMRKDLGLCLDESRRNGASLPATALVDQFYSEIQRRGGGRWDTSSLMRRLHEASD
jgi:3-hydroxyisobutyrate dehydrogenase